jgi:hypothetical protein
VQRRAVYFSHNAWVVAELLSQTSEWTWHFLRDASFRPREETITESLLTEFIRNGQGSVHVYKATITEEMQAGLDWAWAIETPAGWLHLLVQAKQVTGVAFGRYDELRKPRATQQTADLIAAAANFDAIPVFVFYNGEVAPFGGKGSSVVMGACPRHKLVRGNADLGPPWITNCSPLGVTIAHAEDVRDAVLVPPHTNQTAAHVNSLSMPWECLLCPKDAASFEDRPKIWELAQELRDFAGSQSDESLDGSVEWLTPAPPLWAGVLVDGGDPTSASDAPAARYFLRTAMDTNRRRRA